MRDNKSLDKDEFDAAHKWLFEKFKTHFMQNVGLRNRIQTQKKSTWRQDTRNAFKTWKRSLLGNQAFLMAVLRNGLFDTQSQQELMTAVLQEQSNSGDDHLAEHNKKELRRNAFEARRKLKDARKLAYQCIPESQLLCDQNKLLKDLDSGLLERNVLENNKAYGHGEGVKITTQEEAAVFRMSCNALDAAVPPAML